MNYLRSLITTSALPNEDHDRQVVGNHPFLAARLSENARRKAEQFDWSIILPQWEALLTEVAEGQA